MTIQTSRTWILNDVAITENDGDWAKYILAWNIFTWGSNAYGQLGQNDKVSRSSPVQVGSSTDWLIVNASAYNSVGIKSDGTLWGWGSNSAGTLGINDTIPRSSPVQVGNLTDWKVVSSGDGATTPGNAHTLAIKTDGTLWAWGYNQFGQLGTNNTVNISSPVQVGSSTDWKDVNAKTRHSLALKIDGTIWSWGHNSYGELGLGDRFDKSSPVQIGSSIDWQSINTGGASSAGIQSDGTLWTWGYNQFGQLGLIDTNSRSLPTQVGILTNWNQISLSLFYGMAVKIDGTLWALGGFNQSGNFGNNTVTGPGISSPIQVGSSTDWKQVSCCGTGDDNVIHLHTAAIRTDGTLWTWGYNSSGQLGVNNVTNKSSPVQVGSLTSWQSVDIYNKFGIALRH